MKLRHFGARRYRSLKEVELDIEDFLVVLGRNNSGKSTLFHALELFLSPTARGVDENTFFHRKTDQPIVLTATFDQLTFVEAEDLRPWLVNGRLTLRKEYLLDESQRVATNYHVRVGIPEQPWLREDFADYSKRSAVEPLSEFLPPTGRITRELHRQAIARYIETYPDRVTYRQEWQKNPTGFKQAVDKRLPQLHLIPALRDVSDETKSGSSGLLGKLTGLMANRVIHSNPAAHQQIEQALSQIRTVIEGEQGSSKLTEILELQDGVQHALSAWDVKVNIRVDTPDVRGLFLGSTSIEIDDGLQTNIERKGHGLQRSLLFALVQLWAEQSKKGALAADAAWERANIFAFDEPEVFLHPHMCRAVYESLKAIAQTEQVMLCTHSSHFVNMDDYRNLAIMRKADQATGSRAFRVTTDLFEGDHERRHRFNMIGFFNPDRSEVFFANKVILVEGMTEKAILPVLARRLGIFDHSVSIINCGGKGDLVLYMKVLNAFQIPHLVIYDRDGNANSPENLKVERACDPRYGRTHVVIEQVEDLLGIPRQQAEKMGKPYAAVSHYSNPDTPIPPDVEALVREVYTPPHVMRGAARQPIPAAVTHNGQPRR